MQAVMAGVKGHLCCELLKPWGCAVLLLLRWH